MLRWTKLLYLRQIKCSVEPKYYLRQIKSSVELKKVLKVLNWNILTIGWSLKTWFLSFAQLLYTSFLVNGYVGP